MKTNRTRWRLVDKTSPLDRLTQRQAVYYYSYYYSTCIISRRLPSRLMMSQFARLIISHHQQVGKLAHAALASQQSEFPAQELAVQFIWLSFSCWFAMQRQHQQ